MTRRIPMIPTAIVVAAALIMVALGIWQLGRKGEKEALLASYENADTLSSEVYFPENDAEAVQRLFRRSTVRCESVNGVTARAGRSARGEAGWAHIADCRTADGMEVAVALGFSREPTSPAWTGGEVSGWIAPGPRLVAAEGLAGLEPLAPPDPASIPNNHLAYAGQWFFFALTALVIYFLALRRRWRDSET